MSDITHTSELVEINPRVPFLAGPRQLWRNALAHRHLIANTVQRDVRLKYRDSVFGYVWSFLEPLMLSGVYFLLYVILAGKPDVRSPLWIVLGVITWQFFAKSLNDSITCLSRGEGMIKQVYFPRELFALASVASKLVIASLNLLVAIPLMIYYEIAPSPYLLMVPAGLLLAGLLAVGIGLGVACFNVINRDVEFFLRFFIRAGLFLSPVLWTVDMAPRTRAAWLEYLLLNPMAVPITMVRNGIEGRPLGIEPIYVLYSVAVALFCFLAGAMIFKRFEAIVVKEL
jgi:ABC-type polysaccharide/polyol phosphate export permease